jgi:hypothetical protein
MCTGAELAAAGAAAAGTAGTAAAGADAAATGATALGAGLGSMSGLMAAPEAFSPTALATAGQGALASAAPEISTFAASAPETSGMSSGLLQGLGHMGPEQANILAAQNEGFGLGGLNSTLQAANPSYSAASNMLGKGADALGNYNKVQAGMNMMRPQQSGGATTVSKPPSMNQQPMQPLAPPMGGLLGKQQQIPDGAKLMMLKRMGLLGSM